MARRRKQKKQPKPQIKLKSFDATEESRALLQRCAEQGLTLPDFFVDSICGAYGNDAAKDIVFGIVKAKTRPTTFRVNTLRATKSEIEQTLDELGIEHETAPWFDDALCIDADCSQQIWESPLVTDGKIYLQSYSSMLPPLALGAKANEDILDMCAAPGGKTCELACLAPDAHITACEMHAPRADKLEHNLAKQGAKNIQVMRLDARKLDEFFSFDRILLDAPCTGSGTLVADCDRTFRGFSTDLLHKCARSQRALLDRALTVLKPGGTLIYSTCSVLPQENEDAVAEALAKHPDCGLIPLDRYNEPGDNENNAETAFVNRQNPVTDAVLAGELPLVANNLAGTLTVATTHLYEGFYLAKIARKG